MVLLEKKISLIERALCSLINVTAEDFSADLMLKILTFFNLVKKSVNGKIPLTRWIFDNTITKVFFFDETYVFYLPKGFDFNIFLNPYFHEFDITQLVFNFLSEGDVFLDVGAHGGLYTIISGKAVGITGRVLSFEPNPINLHFLRRNIKLNGLSNIIVIPKAVGSKQGKINLFYSPSATSLTSASGKRGKKLEVNVITIDEIANELEFVNVMKIDTEGYDYQVLRGSLNTLDKTSCVLVEQNTPSVREFLESYGFHLSTLVPSGYLLGIKKSFQDSIRQSVIM